MQDTKEVPFRLWTQLGPRKKVVREEKHKLSGLQHLQAGEQKPDAS